MVGSVYDWMKSGFTMVPNFLIDHFDQLKLTSHEFVLIIFLLKQVNQSQSAETVIQLADQFNWEQELLFDTLNSLQDKNYLNIELVSNREGKKTDHYTLRPLFEKLDQLMMQEMKAEAITPEPLVTQNASLGSSQELVSHFEKEFGRVLSPMELEAIYQWIREDAYSSELILHALKEAVIHQAFNIKYIDRILLNWQKQNIQSVDEAKKASQRFNQVGKATTSPTSKTDFKIPILNLKRN